MTAGTDRSLARPLIVLAGGNVRDDVMVVSDTAVKSAVINGGMEGDVTQGQGWWVWSQS